MWLGSISEFPEFSGNVSFKANIWRFWSAGSRWSRWRSYLDEPHLPHCLLVVVVHLADQGVAEVNGDPLDGLVLPGRLQDLQQQLVDPAVLELQLLWDAEVAQRQAAVSLDLQREHGDVSAGRRSLGGMEGSEVNADDSQWPPGTAPSRSAPPGWPPGVTARSGRCGTPCWSGRRGRRCPSPGCFYRIYGTSEPRSPAADEERRR